MRISDWSSDVCSSDLGSGGSAEILVEGFATDPQVTVDDGLALAVINTAVHLGAHFDGAGTFTPALRNPLSGDRTTFARPLPDQGSPAFGTRTHVRNHTVGNSENIARENQDFVNKHA